MKTATPTTNPMSVVQLRRLLIELKCKKRMAPDAIADELERQGVPSGGTPFTGWRVQALCTALCVQNRRGPRPSRSREVWQQIQANMEGLNDAQRAEFLETQVAPALKRAKRDGSLARFAHDPAKVDPAGLMEIQTP